MFLFTMIIILGMFILDITLSLLNYNYRHQPIPQNVSDVYPTADYEKWLSYTMEGFRLSIISKVTNTALLIFMLIIGFFPWLADYTEHFTTHPLLQVLLFLGLYEVISYVFGIGFKLYRTFNIEARYGFNKTTLKTFLADQLKSALLILIIGGVLIYGFLYLYQQLGNSAFKYVWISLVVLSLVINLLYTKVFIRIFNKLTPLKEGELYDKVYQLMITTGYALGAISVMDASKRSSRLNAFFSGFGKFKHIVLYDTLIEKCSPDEVLSVLAHEIGHYKHKDVIHNFLISMVQMGFYLIILQFFLSSTAFASAFGFSETHMGFAIILFGILMEPIGLLLGLPLSALSRKAEYKADAFAASSGYKEAMISALKVLAKENYANLTPHPLVVKLTYSHPPVSMRIEALSSEKF